ncbi:MAG: (deoxy)nucleoside triphosphate pyrophosphohydrolase [Armatimonadetes bacterium]|nr:(deoxy)nucleoside triphosphate pyrophosphohydrolase [Armatimonadota bacterium]
MKPHLQIALALIWREGEVLVSRRLASADHLPDKWEFPGGKIEDAETPQQAAIREAHEEIGLKIEVVATRGPIKWDYAERYVTLHPFDCRIVGGEIAARGVAEVRFVAPAELRSDDFPPANAALIEELTASARRHTDFLY